MILKILFLASVVLLFTTPALAVEGDTKIYVSYRAKAIRVKPTVGVITSNVDIRIRLFANGKVEDSFDIQGRVKGKSKSDLGARSSKTRFKVIDSSTINRISDVGTYVNVMTVKVTGKNCDATIERNLKKGQALFRSANGKEFYSSIENEYTTCVIE